LGSCVMAWDVAANSIKIPCGFTARLSTNVYPGRI
jgi:hypothetical protein